METPTSPAKLVVYVRGNQRKIGPLCDDHDSAIALCRNMFPSLSLSTDELSFYTKDLDICNGQLTEIYSGCWKDVMSQVKELVIQDKTQKISKPVTTTAPPPNFQEVRLRKPVIYLFSPRPVEASVKLSLVRQWGFSAVYPVVPIESGKAGMGDSISWKVRIHPEGHLTELSTGLDVAYLYWESEMTSLPSSPPASPRTVSAGLEDNVQAFDPVNPGLSDENAVVTCVKDITPYFDAALKALGLNVEARTSFITYWLPSWLKHKYIAFRFLSQASYEQAAPLCVSPTPDIVTRIFMVFKGVEESELGSWPAAQSREKAVSSWIDTVGVDVGSTLDEDLFRVIEWGGMEIPL